MARRDPEGVYVDDLRSVSNSFLNQNIHLFGAERAIEAMQPGMIARATACGVPHAEVRRILGRIDSFGDWPASWSQAADDYRELGMTAAEQGHWTTATDLLVRATALFFYAQLFLELGSSNKERIVAQMIECYRMAGRHFIPPLETVEIPFKDIVMPGYLRVPQSDGRSPCVVMVDGADTVKEELHGWADLFVRRGIAALYFDGPGQGETFEAMRMYDRYEESLSAVLDWLTRRPDIDSEHVVVWGISLGGYLAARALATDTRWTAGVCVGGFFDARGFPYRRLHGQERWRQMFGLPDIASMRAYVAERISLRGLLSSLDRPLLVVHSGRDLLVSVNEIQCFVDEAPDMVELWMYDDAYHALWDVYEIVSPLTTDWVAERLLGHH